MTNGSELGFELFLAPPESRPIRSLVNVLWHATSCGDYRGYSPHIMRRICHFLSAIARLISAHCAEIKRPNLRKGLASVAKNMERADTKGMPQSLGTRAASFDTGAAVASLTIRQAVSRRQLQRRLPSELPTHAGQGQLPVQSRHQFGKNGDLPGVALDSENRSQCEGEFPNRHTTGFGSGPCPRPRRAGRWRWRAGVRRRRHSGRNPAG